MPFHLGDPVRWLSQARGKQKDTMGIVVDIVPAGQLPDRERWRQLHRIAGPNAKLRAHESYIVQCGVRAYWPHTWKLRAVDSEIHRLRIEATQMRIERDAALRRLCALDQPIGAATDLTV